MSDMDVSLRVRLVNQLSRPAEEAERDLKALQRAAEQLGRTKTGSGLAQDINALSRGADTAKAKLGQIGAEANEARAAIGRIGSGFNGISGAASGAFQAINRISAEAGEARAAIARIGSGFDGIAADADKGQAAITGIRNRAEDARLAVARIGEGFGNLKADAASAEGALGGIEQRADQTRAALGRIGDGAFDGLKADANAAEEAVRQIGTAADTAASKLKQMTVPHGQVSGGANGQPMTPWRSTQHLPPAPGGIMTTVEGAVDQFGVPIALGAGSAYLAGAGPAAGALVAGAAVNAAAGDEFVLDQLQTTGGFSDEEAARYRQMLGAAGARHGIGAQGAMDVFGALQAGGLSSQDAAVMTNDAITFAKASSAQPADAANTAIALRNNMKIPANQMMTAYDAMALGGKEGQFEVKDMAQHFPSMLAAMGAQGSEGIGGVQLATAMAQSIRKTTGSGDQAKTVFEAMLTDMVSPDVVERAKEYGIDVYGTKKKAVAEGKDPVMTLLETYRSKLGGDEVKMRDVFRNSTAYQGYDAIFKDMPGLLEMIQRMQNAKGTVAADYETATGNFNSQRDRLSSNLGENIKTTSAPLLPALTAATEALAGSMERIRENEQKNALLNAPVAGPMNWLVNMMVDKGGEGRPSALQRFLYGDAAEEGFNLREHMGIGRQAIPVPTPRPARGGDDLGQSTGQIGVPSPRPQEFGQAASDGMGAYNNALAEGGAQAEAEARSIADRIRALLGFTVSPTIAPTYVQPSAAGAGAPVPAAPEKHSSLIQPTSVQTNRFTTNISSPNIKHAEMRNRRERARQIQLAKARSLYDTERRLT